FGPVFLDAIRPEVRSACNSLRCLKFGGEPGQRETICRVLGQVLKLPYSDSLGGDERAEEIGRQHWVLCQQLVAYGDKMHGWEISRALAVIALARCVVRK